MMRAIALVVMLAITAAPAVATGKCTPQPAKHWVCIGQPSHATGYVFPKALASKCKVDAERVVILSKLYGISAKKTDLLGKYGKQVGTLTNERNRAMADVVALSAAVSEGNVGIRNCNADKAALAEVAKDLNERLSKSYQIGGLALIGGGAFVLGVVTVLVWTRKE